MKRGKSFALFCEKILLLSTAILREDFDATLPGGGRRIP